MNRNVVFIDFDGCITNMSNWILADPPPPFFVQATNLGGGILKNEEVAAALEGCPTAPEKVAVSRYKLVYISSNKVFYGRFE